MNEARFSPLYELTRSRVVSFVREPGALFWVFVFPVLLAVALGIAFRSKPPESLQVVIVEAGPASLVQEHLTAADGLAATTLPRTEAQEALRTGRYDLLIEALTGDDGKAPRLLYRFDPTRPQSRAARLAADDALQRAFGRSDPVSVSEDVVTEPGARYIDYLLPGLIGLNLMGSGMYGIGFVLVMARTRKLLKRLAATPMRRSHYLLSMALSRLVFLAMEMVALLAFGRWVFGVRVQGSYLTLGVVVLTGAAAFTGMALLVGSRARSVEVASGLMNFIMLPMWVLSGSFFSYTRFPEVLQPAIRLLPLTALNDAIRAVMNDGASLAATSGQLLILIGWCVVSFLVALRIFRWQ